MFPSGGPRLRLRVGAGGGSAAKAGVPGTGAGSIGTGSGGYGLWQAGGAGGVGAVSARADCGIGGPRAGGGTKDMRWETLGPYGEKSVGGRI